MGRKKMKAKIEKDDESRFRLNARTDTHWMLSIVTLILLLLGISLAAMFNYTL
jgi:hypothetical protein